MCLAGGGESAASMCAGGEFWCGGGENVWFAVMSGTGAGALLNLGVKEGVFENDGEER